MTEPLCILTVHAHPDDEASKGAGTIARYQAEGVHTVLVCCTGGEEGEILNPAMDRPEVIENLGAVRREELARATEIIGYDTVHMLGYRDSGMPESDANFHPDCFAVAPFDEAVDRLVAILRAERPQVIVTYPEDQGSYQHPDHLRVWDITLPAVERAADASHRPDLGGAWSVSKIYASTWSRARLVARHEAFLAQGLESPYDEKWFERPDQDHTITAKVSIEGYTYARREGLLAHATQIDPNSTFWFGLPPEVEEQLHPWDDYLQITGLDTGDAVEDDLFAGLRPAVVES
ncbi:MAG: PIG-L family deacetylase [Actinomycetota bacterium]